MTLIKLSRPSKIEKESGAGVPNLPTGPDHEDDTTNQGSGDAEAPILPTGSDLEDEDGDREIPCPSSYLNLDQYDNEEDATSDEQAPAPTNAEHEGNVNEEEERNAE
jgi:hypothetical protein